MKTDFDVRVKMRDGVELSADIYRPDAEGKFPVILNRTPYTKPGSFRSARYFVERGYVFVAMDVRGRGDSDGKFVPYRNDGQDGYDAVEWCAVQPWSTGKVATIGGSYNGRIQWLTAVLQPPHLTTMIVLVTPADTYVEWPPAPRTHDDQLASFHRRAMFLKAWTPWIGPRSRDTSPSIRWTKPWAVRPTIGKRTSTIPCSMITGSHPLPEQIRPGEGARPPYLRVV